MSVRPLTPRRGNRQSAMVDWKNLNLARAPGPFQRVATVLSDSLARGSRARAGYEAQSLAYPSQSERPLRLPPCQRTPRPKPGCPLMASREAKRQSPAPSGSALCAVAYHRPPRRVAPAGAFPGLRVQIPLRAAAPSHPIGFQVLLSDSLVRLTAAALRLTGP